MENGQIVSTTATFTVTNSGKDAVASPSLMVNAPFNNAGAASGGCATGTAIPGIGSAPANTCIIVVNYPGTAGTPGVINDSPGVLINGGSANDSIAAALLTGTIQTPSSLKLVGFGSSEPAVDLGSVNVNTPAAGQGGQAILLYRNEGGHDTAKVNYYFWTNAAGANGGLAVQGTAGADTDDFKVVPELSTCFQGSAILHSGQYCKVVVSFQPKHEGLRLAGFTLSDAKTAPTQKVDFKGYGIDPASNVNDKVIITPNFASLIGTPSSAGQATTVAEYTTIPTQGFTITNTFTSAITVALNLTNSNFTMVAEPAGTTTPACTSGAALAAGSACGVWVKFWPATGAAPVFQPGSLSVGVTGAATETVSAGMMGRARRHGADGAESDHWSRLRQGDPRDTVGLHALHGDEHW